VVKEIAGKISARLGYSSQL